MGYDLKSGWIIRGCGADPEYERIGRRQQYIAKMVASVIAIAVVTLAYQAFFSAGMFAPVDSVYIATIDAGADSWVARNLVIWAIPGAILQAVGGSERQIGILFATGLLISTPMAGVTVLIGILIRIVVLKRFGEQGQNNLYILGAGFITGATLYSFFSSTLSLGKKLH